MSIAIADTPVEFVTGRANTAEETVRAKVWSLVSKHFPQHNSDRRGDQRFPFAQLLIVTPATNVRTEDRIIVVGKHLSEKGLGMFHPQPLPYRRVIASVEASPGEWVGFLIDLSWCRFTRFGWYESGGRILDVVPSPLAGGPALETGALDAQLLARLSAAAPA
jgi:hypothetical protein